MNALRFLSTAATSDESRIIAELVEENQRLHQRLHQLTASSPEAGAIEMILRTIKNGELYAVRAIFTDGDIHVDMPELVAARCRELYRAMRTDDDI